MQRKGYEASRLVTQGEGEERNRREAKRKGLAQIGTALFGTEKEENGEAMIGHGMAPPRNA